MARAREIEGLSCETPFAEAAARTIETRTDELFSFAGAVLETEDIEGVHDMRVATRRLRAAIEIYWDALPKGERKKALRSVKRLADALGERRDPDVQIEWLEKVGEALRAEDRPGVESLVAALRERQRAANATLAGALAEARSTELRDRLLGLAATAGERAREARDG